MSTFSSHIGLFAAQVPLSPAADQVSAVTLPCGVDWRFAALFAPQTPAPLSSRISSRRPVDARAVSAVSTYGTGSAATMPTLDFDVDEAMFGDPVQEPEEEAFLVFSQPIPSQNLGFVDAKASALDLAVAGRQLSIQQSPSLLTSNRAEGTTGAVVWKITPLFADWITSPENAFFRRGLLGPSSTIVELGAGVSGVVALALAPKIARYIATDQDYVLKLLRQNINQNESSANSHQSGPHKNKLRGKTRKPQQAGAQTSNISVVPLDWETSLPSSVLPSNGVDALIACDCIYNEALVAPFVGACADICALRPDVSPTFCIIAQQLRSPDVFEVWLKAFWEKFVVWRIPDELLADGLKEGNGFVVHVGVLREAASQ